MQRIIEYCLVSADGTVLDDPFPFRDYQDDAYSSKRKSKKNIGELTDS